MAGKDGKDDKASSQPAAGAKPVGLSPLNAPRGLDLRNLGGAPMGKPETGKAEAGKPATPPPGDAKSQTAKEPGAEAPKPFADFSAKAPEMTAALGRLGRDAFDRLNVAQGSAVLSDVARQARDKLGAEVGKRAQARPAAKAAAAPQASGKQKRLLRGLIVFGIGAVIVYLHARSNVPALFGRSASPDAVLLGQLAANLGAGVIGLILGAVPVLLFTRYRDIGIALGALLLLYAVLFPAVGMGMTLVSGVVGVVAGLVLSGAFFMKKDAMPDTFGTSRWATLEDLDAAGLTGEEGYRLGAFVEGKEEALIRYAGQRHLLTVAPTRAGKGVSAIIPNLLTYRGSALVIDPKGENALITAKRRKALGQAVHMVDPWNITAGKLGMAAARFNPLDMLKPDDPDFVENAVLVADALVVGGDAKDRFWDDEARAFLVGIILWVATAPEEAGNRHLGRVRDLLMLEADAMADLFQKMIQAKHTAVNAAGGRAMQKEEKLLSNVLATVQSHTNMLDSPRIRQSLSGSDLQFGDLKTAATTIYLILPADRLDTYGRWLRLLVQQALVVNARNIDVKPERPILFLLDEMAALGRLAMVEQAYGLMAGFGMQLWGIVQDLSQLKRLYGDGWETFVGNSGVLQYFGSRDRMTAEYFSALCGVTTVWNISTAISSAVGGDSESTTTSATQRSLAFPDELMTMRGERQLLLVESGYPIKAMKRPWFNDPTLSQLAG
jgi:type IV secretion system protein VirD4